MLRLLLKIVTAIIILFSTLAMANHYFIREEARQFDAEMCVAVYSNFCINQTCLTSTDRDCQPRCREMASSKCAYEQGLYYDDSYNH